MGRKPKPTFESYDDQLAYIFAKLFDTQIDENGDIKYVRTGECLSLEEMAFVRWHWDGCPEKGPITKMGELKKEAKLLQKIKLSLLQSNYSLEEVHDLIAVLSKERHEYAECSDKVESIDY